MGLHDEIRAACAEAAPAIARAADGSEASIYNLRFCFANLASVLMKDGAVVDALKAKGITVSIDGPWPKKFA